MARTHVRTCGCVRARVSGVPPGAPGAVCVQRRSHAVTWATLDEKDVLDKVTKTKWKR